MGPLGFGALQTSSSIYENKDGSTSITFGNYKTINIEPESDSETESIHVNVVNIEENEILLTIETVENYIDTHN